MHCIEKFSPCWFNSPSLPGTPYTLSCFFACAFTKKWEARRSSRRKVAGTQFFNTHEQTLFFLFFSLISFVPQRKCVGKRVTGMRFSSRQRGARKPTNPRVLSRALEHAGRLHSARESRLTRRKSARAITRLISPRRGWASEWFNLNRRAISSAAAAATAQHPSAFARSLGVFQTWNCIARSTPPRAEARPRI